MNIEDIRKLRAEGLQPWLVTLAWPYGGSESDTFSTTVWAKDEEDAIDQCKHEMVESECPRETAAECTEYKESISSNAIECYPLAPAVCRDLGELGLRIPDAKGAGSGEPPLVSLLLEIQHAPTNTAALEAGVKLVALLRTPV